MNELIKSDKTDVDINIICRYCGKKLFECKCNRTDNNEFFSRWS